MAMSTPRLVRLPPAHHDRRAVPGSGLAVDEALVPRRRSPAHDADRLELVDDLGHRHQDGHGAEGLAPEVAVGAGDDHAHSRSEEHTSELQSQSNIVCRLLLEKKKSLVSPGTSAGMAIRQGSYAPRRTSR